jgi:hypothetical protein
MTVLALLVLLLAAATPGLLPVLRTRIADPVLPVAAVAVVLLAVSAAVAATTDPADGWRLAAALVVGVAAATTGGGVVVRAVFRLMRREFRPARTAPPPATVESAAEPDPSPAEPETGLRGDAWIGYLERGAAAATLLAGWPEGVALVLAVKGVGRYSELREPNAPEAFIIGTLASLLWAAGATGAAQLLR